MTGHDGAILAHAAVRLQRDLHDVLPHVNCMRFLAYEEWSEPLPATSRTLLAGVPLPGEIVCLVSGTSFTVSTSGGLQGILQQTADRLQERVMDELNGAWPAVDVGGRKVVLAAELDELGTAVWTTPGGPTCPVGYLYQAVGRIATVTKL